MYLSREIKTRKEWSKMIEISRCFDLLDFKMIVAAGTTL